MEAGRGCCPPHSPPVTYFYQSGLISFPQPPTHHQLGTKHLNTRACRGHFTCNPKQQLQGANGVCSTSSTWDDLENPSQSRTVSGSGWAQPLGYSVRDLQSCFSAWTLMLSLAAFQTGGGWVEGRERERTINSSHYPKSRPSSTVDRLGGGSLGQQLLWFHDRGWPDRVDEPGLTHPAEGWRVGMERAKCGQPPWLMQCYLLSNLTQGLSQVLISQFNFFLWKFLFSG